MDLKLSPRDQTILAVIIAILIVLGFGILGIRPQFSRIAELRTLQQDEQKKKQDSEATLKRLQESKKAAAETEAKLIEVKKRLPEEPQLASLLIETQDAANQAGVDLVSIKPGEMVQQTDLTTIPLQMHVEGEFLDLVEFLIRLKDLKREVRIDKITISGAEYPVLAVDLAGNTFTLAKPPTKAAAESQTGQPSAPKQE